MKFTRVAENLNGVEPDKGQISVRYDLRLVDERGAGIAGKKVLFFQNNQEHPFGERLTMDDGRVVLICTFNFKRRLLRKIYVLEVDGSSFPIEVNVEESPASQVRKLVAQMVSKVIQNEVSCAPCAFSEEVSTSSLAHENKSAAEDEAFIVDWYGYDTEPNLGELSREEVETKLSEIGLDPQELFADALRVNRALRLPTDGLMIPRDRAAMEIIRDSVRKGDCIVELQDHRILEEEGLRGLLNRVLGSHEIKIDITRKMKNTLQCGSPFPFRSIDIDDLLSYLDWKVPAMIKSGTSLATVKKEIIEVIVRKVGPLQEVGGVKLVCISNKALDKEKPLSPDRDFEYIDLPTFIFYEVGTQLCGNTFGRPSALNAFSEGGEMVSVKERRFRSGVVLDLEDTFEISNLKPSVLGFLRHTRQQQQSQQQAAAVAKQEPDEWRHIKRSLLIAAVFFSVCSCGAGIPMVIVLYAFVKTFLLILEHLSEE